MKKIVSIAALLMLSGLIQAQNSFPATGSATLNGSNVVLNIQNTSESQWSGSGINFYNTQTALGSTIWFKHEKTSSGALTGSSNFIWRYSEPNAGYVNMMLFQETSKNIFLNYSKTHPGNYGNVIVNNGNFLINTTVPQAKLTVNGDIYLGKSETIGGWNYSHLRYAGHSLVISSPNDVGSHNVLDIKPGGKDGYVCYSDLRLWRANGTDDSQKEKVVQISTNNVTYFNGGNVGIGTNDPGAYKLAVNGTIRAKEVKVETGWADFVFEEDYQLMDLMDLKSYVKQNKHLPEIPSAVQVAAEGVSLGEMDKLLLQKIEELTLYVIQQQEQIKEQQERIKVLEAKQ